MQYAQLNKDGSYSHQITTNNNVAWDATHFCPASKLTPEDAVFFRVVPLTETQPPVTNTVTQSVMRDGGEFVAGQWQYKWRVDELFATQAAKDAAIAEDTEAKRRATVTPSVTMRQARLALLDAGLLAQVDTAINAFASPEKERAQIEWEFAQTVDRYQPFTLLLGAALGLSDVRLDALFVTAAAL